MTAARKVAALEKARAERARRRQEEAASEHRLVGKNCRCEVVVFLPVLAAKCRHGLMQEEVRNGASSSRKAR